MLILNGFIMVIILPVLIHERKLTSLLVWPPPLTVLPFAIRCVVCDTVSVRPLYVQELHSRKMCDAIVLASRH